MSKSVSNPAAMPESDKIKIGLSIPSVVISAVAKIGAEIVRALLEGTGDNRQDMVVIVKNYTGVDLAQIQYSTKHNNGGFKDDEPPLNYIRAKSIGGIASHGDSLVGNKNYVLYDLDGNDLLIYWHVPKVGFGSNKSSNYWIDFRSKEKVKEGRGFRSMDDHAILDYGKHKQIEGHRKDKAGKFRLVASRSTNSIFLDVFTDGQLPYV